ncbi:uncharacterized protein FN964_006734 isoform 4-T8 [Alca torda]
MAAGPTFLRRVIEQLKKRCVWAQLLPKHEAEFMFGTATFLQPTFPPPVVSRCLRRNNVISAFSWNSLSAANLTSTLDLRYVVSFWLKMCVQAHTLEKSITAVYRISQAVISSIRT